MSWFQKKARGHRHADVLSARLRGHWLSARLATCRFGFTKYDSTVTHGFGPISMTLDLYDLPNATTVA